MAKGDSSDALSMRGYRKVGVPLVIVLSLVLQCRAQSQPIACMLDSNTNSSCSSSSICGQDSACKVSGENANETVCDCCSGYFSLTGSHTDCRSSTAPDPNCGTVDLECIYCGITFQGPCFKCTNNVMDGSCVATCPGSNLINYQINAIANTSLSARVCNEQQSSDSTSLPTWAIILIAVLAGVVLIIGIVFLGVFSFTVLNRTSSGQFDIEDERPFSGDRVPLRPPTNSEAHQLNRVSTGSQEYQDGNHYITQNSPSFDDNLILTTDCTIIIEGIRGDKNPSIGTNEEVIFHHKLDYLRGHAEVFLKMLNDMRRRLKELPPDAPAAVQYRNVMRDVTRLLYLLNKKPSAIEVPPDGLQLLTWSEQILERYQKSQGYSPRGNSHQTSTLSTLGAQTETQF